MSRVYRAFAGMLLVGLLALAACSSGPSANTTNGNGGNVSGKTPATAPTATSRPKPSSVPTITLAFCQSIMTVAQANQIMNPPSAATQIEVNSDPQGLSLCNWDNPQAVVLEVGFEPSPIASGTSLQTAAQQLIANGQARGLSGAKITTAPVSGVGDQALYVTLNDTTPQGITLSIDELVTAYGSVLIECLPPPAIGSTLPNLQAPLTQVCQKAVAQL